jgi:ribosome-binding ATPase YchF (GTP1/OBG family)
MWDLKKIESNKKKLTGIDVAALEKDINLGKKYEDNTGLNLLGAKPYLILCNGDDQDLINKVKEKYSDSCPILNFSVAFCEELQNDCDTESPEVNDLIFKGFELLNLITYFNSKEF